MRSILFSLAILMACSLIVGARATSGPAGKATVHVAQASTTPRSKTTSASESSGPRFNRIGVNSCTAQACHGSPVRKQNGPVWGNEYAIWMETDPHAEAYSDLFQERSKRMVRLVDPGKEAHQSQRCLVCHSLGMPPAGKPQFALSEGVSCEACHGAASEWMAVHTSPTWKNMSAEFQHKHHGLNHLKSLSARAKKCAECHVGTGDRDGDGSPDRDMNHDLIAAGHPRLNFEFDTYLANYPKHWEEKTWDANGRVQKSEPPAGFEARAWAIGQVAVAQAGLELLAARASASVENKPHSVWPELAEYSCFDCHHDLGADSWRRENYAAQLTSQPARKLGQPAWGSWHYAMLPLLANAPNLEAGESLEPFNKLRTTMARLNAPAVQAAGDAASAAAALDAWLATLETAEYDEAAVGKLLKTLAEQGPEALTTWDAAAQLYLALVSVQQARPDDAEARQALERFAAALAFETRDAEGKQLQLDSPGEFKPRESITEILRQFEQTLPKP